MRYNISVISVSSLYAVLSILCFSAIAPYFYIDNMLNCGIRFTFSVPYIAITLLYIYVCKVILRNMDLRYVIYACISSAALVSLLYLFVEMKIGIDILKPFKGARNIYDIYAKMYSFIFMGIFSVFNAFSLKSIIFQTEKESFADRDRYINSRILFFMPVMITFFYSEFLLFFKGHIFFSSVIFIIFLAVLFYKKSQEIVIKFKKIFFYIINDERIVLLLLFLAAFLIRYYWGVRLIGLSGDNFLIASDDGPAYDQFASILSSGRLLPEGEVYGLSGFGYWYFLGFVYKIFGIHNFKAIVFIQALIASFVPVITYCVARHMSGNKVVSFLAGIITCFDMTLVFLSVVIGMEAIYIPLVTLSLFFMILFIKSKLSYMLALSSGLALGLAYNFRSPELILFPFIFSVIIYFMPSYERELKKSAAIFIFLLSFFIIISSQYIFNYIVYNETPRLQGAAASSFHIGIAEGGYVDENKVLGRMGFSPFEDITGSLSAFSRNPFKVTSLIASGFVKRLMLLYFLPNFGLFDPFYIINPNSGYLFRFPLYVQFYGYVLVLIGMIRAFINNKSRLAAIVLLALFSYISFRTAFFYVLNSRYRGLLLPICAVFLAYGLGFVFDRIRDSYNHGVCKND